MRALKVELEAPWAVPVGRAATVAGAAAWGAKAAMVVRRAAPVVMAAMAAARVALEVRVAVAGEMVVVQAGCGVAAQVAVETLARVAASLAAAAARLVGMRSLEHVAAVAQGAAAKVAAATAAAAKEAAMVMAAMAAAARGVVAEAAEGLAAAATAVAVKKAAMVMARTAARVTGSGSARRVGTAAKIAVRIRPRTPQCSRRPECCPGPTQTSPRARSTLDVATACRTWEAPAVHLLLIGGRAHHVLTRAKASRLDAHCDVALPCVRGGTKQLPLCLSRRPLGRPLNQLSCGRQRR
eukprot:scaffold16679_cov37-Phaeocystis_antarctica.AAC.1